MSELKKLFYTALTDVKTAAQGDVEGLGTIRIDSDGKAYIWVMNGESTAQAAGDVVCFDVGYATLANMTKHVKTPATANLMYLAGVCMGAIPASGYGWVQYKGYHAAAKIDAPVTSAIAVGSSLSCSDGLDYFLTGTAAGTAPLYASTAICLEGVATVATGSTTTAKVLLSCPFLP